MLPMLYSATLLAPIPFGFARISIILVLAFGSYACAYIASSQFGNTAEANRFSFKRVMTRPPFLIWIVAFVIITVQLASGLTMVYLAHQK
jgi:hypothetical protein